MPSTGSNPLKNPQQELRYSNAHGKIIPMHHAFKTLHLASVSRVSAMVLPVLFVGLLWLFLPMVFELWSAIFNFWMQHIYHSGIGHAPVSILGQDLSIPYPVMDAEAPSQALVRMNLLVCVIAFAVSFLIPMVGAPLTYLLRTILLIQGSASLDRMLAPDFFPYTLKVYMLGAMTQCVYMLFLIPLILAVVYYIFDFSLWRKFLLTVMLLAFFLIAVPCQYMLHAYLIHEFTLLFLPLMYMMFGIVMDVLMFVSIYAYGMSWKSRKEALQGRGI